MNVAHLNTFRHLIEVKNFTQTAQKLHMTQPGVSQHVRWLEDYFGEKLIRTAGKKFEVTPKGNEVYQYAVRFFSEHEVFRKSLKQDDPKTGLCRISSPGSIGIGLYSELLKINKSNPGLAIQFHYAPNKTIQNELLENKIDLGFMTIAPEERSLEAKKIGEEELLIVIPKVLKIKTFDDLMNLGFINHPDGKDMLEKVIELNFPDKYRDFSDVKISGGSNQIGRILEPVSLGLGFTVLPHHAYEAFSAKNKLSLFPLKKSVTNNIYLVKKKHKLLAARFNFVTKELEKRIGWS